MSKQPNDEKKQGAATDKSSVASALSVTVTEPSTSSTNDAAEEASSSTSAADRKVSEISAGGATSCSFASSTSATTTSNDADEATTSYEVRMRPKHRPEPISLIVPSPADVLEFKEGVLVFEDDRTSGMSPSYPPRPLHRKQRSNESQSFSLLSSSLTSFRNHMSRFSLDNSVFDVGASSYENSAVATPIEKVFPRDYYAESLLERMEALRTELESKNKTSEEEALRDEPVDRSDSSESAEEDFGVKSKNLVLENDVFKDDATTNTTVPATSSHSATAASASRKSSVLQDSIRKISADIRKASFSSASVEVSTSDETSLNATFSPTPAVPLRLSSEGLRETWTPSPSPIPVRKIPVSTIRASKSADEIQSFRHSVLPLPKVAPRLDRLASECLQAGPSSSRGQYVLQRTIDRDHHKQLPGRRYGTLRTIDVLRVKILCLKGIKGNVSKPIYLLAKLDSKDVHFSATLRRDSSDPVLEEFTHDGAGYFDNLHIVVLEGSRTAGKSPRPIGRITIKRQELIQHSGQELTRPLRVVSKRADVQGQICLNIKRNANSFAVRVVDHCELNIAADQELFLLVHDARDETKEPRKLRIHPQRFSEEWLEMECEEGGTLELRMTLWRELLRGLNNVFHGQVRVDVDERWTNGPAKWFYLRPRHSENSSSKDSPSREALGSMRFWLSYSSQHVLPIETYRPLMLALSSAHSTQPFSASLLSIIENLPKIDLGVVARPLLQSMATTNELRPLLSALYNAEIDRHEDLNTLFRGQSLASRILYEVLNVYGHHYLVVTLKPIIDKIYKERKSCEIDPSRIGPGESLEKNMANLLSYFALMFNRVVDSAPRCPAPIKTLLADLRNVVRERTNRLEIERLALSSFLVMRFFAAAILNPRAFGLKKDQPDPRCARSLLLLSKILQRVANCCVSEQKLSTKEPWLTSVFTQVTDEQHITAMANFLDLMSLQQLEPSLSSESIAVLKDGYLVETRTGPRHAWRNMLNPKRRYVMLTDTDLVWQKSHRGDFNPKGSVSLTDIRSLIPEGKSVLKLKTDKEEVAFETTGQMETTEWLTAIERQRARARRMSEKTELHELVDSDVERDLETLHMLLMGHADTLTSWKSCIELKKSVPEGIPVIPNRLDGSTIENEAARTQHCESLCRTLEQTLNIVYAIEEAHRDALNAYTAQMMSGSGTRDEPIGDENYLVLKRQLNAQP